MNYRQTISYLFGRLPMYQRVGNVAFKKDLNNTKLFCKVLNEPQRKFTSIHIAGTNGKGSVSHYLASVLQSAGYKTGLYTSPHLKDFRERIKINGKMISQKSVVEFVQKYKNDIENIDLSFFELTVCMAFDDFAKKNVDVAVIETGLGGRLDSTNIIQPILSVITNISFDHIQMLGNTLEKIAIEKAGIIKKQIPVVIGETKESIKTVFIQKAKENEAGIYFADQKFSIIEKENVKTYSHIYDAFENQKLYLENIENPLLGNYQKKNISTVLQSCEILNRGGLKISKQSIKSGIKNVIIQTGLQGRWQILQEKPLVVCDIAHNKAGLEEALKQLQKLTYQNIHFVLGFVNDKDLSVLALFPKDGNYYFCKPDVPRGLDENELSGQAKKYSLHGSVFQSVKDALENARSKASKDDLVYVGGSAFVVAEVL